jgi:hypothetical protein
VFVHGAVYALVTALGFLSLESPQDPIGDPYITVMRLLIIPLAALYVVTTVAIHAYARPAVKMYSLTALVFMVVLATITTSVHFVGITVGPRLEATGLSWVPLIVSFEWPSIVYALDVLAWDWFFALSPLCCPRVQRRESDGEMGVDSPPREWDTESRGPDRCPTRGHAGPERRRRRIRCRGSGRVSRDRSRVRAYTTSAGKLRAES